MNGRTRVLLGELLEIILGFLDNGCFLKKSNKKECYTITPERHFWVFLQEKKISSTSRAGQAALKYKNVAVEFAAWGRMCLRPKNAAIFFLFLDVALFFLHDLVVFF
jgi:hypothetical protein